MRRNHIILRMNDCSGVKLLINEKTKLRIGAGIDFFSPQFCFNYVGILMANYVGVHSNIIKFILPTPSCHYSGCRSLNLWQSRAVIDEWILRLYLELTVVAFQFSFTDWLTKLILKASLVCQPLLIKIIMLEYTQSTLNGVVMAPNCRFCWECRSSRGSTRGRGSSNVGFTETSKIW